MKLIITELVGDTMKDKDLLKEKNPFKLSSFIKNKILGMYGIKKNSVSSPVQTNGDLTDDAISSLLPKDNTKI